MHGSPLSKYDNRDFWKHYNYRNLGIIGDPYFDLNFSKIAFYPDTGRIWAVQKYSVRDKILLSHSFPSSPSSNLPNCKTAQPAFSANADKSGRLHNCTTLILNQEPKINS
jgi:hypothetical protein